MRQIVLLLLVTLALLALASCSTAIPGEQSTSVKKSATGTTVVDTFTATATVTSIDTSNRKLVLRLSDGRRKTVKCGPEIVNFRQILISSAAWSKIFRLGMPAIISGWRSKNFSRQLTH